jgi:dTDP-4-dehydrorhamnose 3,5-epimerase
MAQIDGVQVVPLITREDDRGFLTEIARTVQDTEPHGVVHKFGQVYIVYDYKAGIIRAFHRHQSMWDWYFISSGRAKVVLKDDRPKSRTLGQVQVIVSSLSSPKLIGIPPGVWHGWQSLANHTTLISIASEPYNRDNPDEERVGPYSIVDEDVWKVEMR